VVYGPAEYVLLGAPALALSHDAFSYGEVPMRQKIASSESIGQASSYDETGSNLKARACWLALVIFVTILVVAPRSSAAAQRLEVTLAECESFNSSSCPYVRVAILEQVGDNRYRIIEGRGDAGTFKRFEGTFRLFLQDRVTAQTPDGFQRDFSWNNLSSVTRVGAKQWLNACSARMRVLFREGGGFEVNQISLFNNGMVQGGSVETFRLHVPDRGYKDLTLGCAIESIKVLGVR
jgi:hypothetical protein